MPIFVGGLDPNAYAYWLLEKNMRIFHTETVVYVCCGSAALMTHKGDSEMGGYSRTCRSG
jgi:hypothetical protein